MARDKTSWIGETFTDNGKIYFDGILKQYAELIYGCVRRASICFIGEFNATTFNDLFEAVISIPWENWLPKDARFPVTGRCVKSVLMSVSDCQSIIKKAVVERLKKVYRLETFPETGPRYHIDFSITKDKFIISLDTTGDGLHKRGYRSLGYNAPIKETLAAAMLMISRWSPGKHLIDPFCGSGTIPVEAALMAINKAPGLDREFDCQEWPVIPKEVWYNALNEARDLIKPVNEILIQGFDINPEAISMANYHARQAGVSEIIHFRFVMLRIFHQKQNTGLCNQSSLWPEAWRKEEKQPALSGNGQSFRSFLHGHIILLMLTPSLKSTSGEKPIEPNSLTADSLLLLPILRSPE